VVSTEAPRRLLRRSANILPGNTRGCAYGSPFRRRSARLQPRKTIKWSKPSAAAVLVYSSSAWDAQAGALDDGHRAQLSCVMLGVGAAFDFLGA